MTDCMYEEEPKIIGRINRKKSNPAENNKILLPSGSSTVEFKAASIKRPNNKTADTSVIPVKIDKKPDCRIQKFDEYRHMYKDMYYCDNAMQFGIAIEDLEYTKWLDPAGVPCYVKDD